MPQQAKILENLEKIKYSNTLAEYFVSKPNYLDEPIQRKPNIRKLVEQPWQQTVAGMWDEVTETLCDLEFIQSKAAAKMTFDLMNDFNAVLQQIPDNTVNVREENERRLRMDKYSKDLIAFARGEMKEIEVPGSIIPWSGERMNTENDRIKNNPARLDRLKDFMNFLGQEAANLQSYAHENSYFAIQQAWNYISGGFVAQATLQTPPEFLKKLFLRASATRSAYIPFPQILKRLSGHNEPVVSVNMTPDGSRALSCSKESNTSSKPGLFIFWDLKTGQPLKSLSGSTLSANHYCNIPEIDQPMFITGDRYLVICDIETDQVYGFPEAISSVACVNSNGRFLLHAWNYPGDTQKFCCIRDLEKGRRSDLKVDFNGIDALNVTPDGKRVLLGVNNVRSGDENNYPCILFDVADILLLKTLYGHTGFVTSVSMTPDGKLAISGSHDNTCIVWDLESGKALHILRGHSSIVSTVSITPDGHMAISGSFDKTCILWNTETGKALKTLKGHFGLVTSVSITPDGQYALSGSDDGTCILWNLARSQDTGMPDDPLFPATALSVSHDGKFAMVGTHSQTCILRDLETGQILKTLKHKSKVSDNEILSVSICPDNKHAIAASGDHTCMLWDVKTGQALKKLEGHSGRIEHICITPDNNRALTGSSDSTYILWNLKTGRAVKTLTGDFSSISALILTPDGRYAISGLENNTCKIWDLETGQELKTLEGNKSYIKSIAVFPDSKYLMTASPYDCLLWNLETGQVSKILHGHAGRIFRVLLTSDGRHALSVSYDNKCFFWDMKSGNLLRDFIGHTKWINAICLTPDNKHAVSGSDDNTCILWDIETGQILSRYAGEFPIEEVSIFPGGIICGGRYGETIVLHIDKKILNSGPGIVTIRRIWDFTKHKYLDVSADCPFCGHRFTPPGIVLNTIETIIKNADPKPGQSPCLELPDQAWQNPELTGECPACHEKIKYNPFFGTDAVRNKDHIFTGNWKFYAQQVYDNAELALKAGNWDKAYLLYMKLAPAEEFDLNNLRYRIAMCAVNSFDTFDREDIVTYVNKLIKQLRKNGAGDTAQTIKITLKLQLKNMERKKSSGTKVVKPWWKKF